MSMLERTLPENVGVMSASIINFIESARQQNVELHSFMLLRHGKICSELWWEPYSPDIPHHMYSFSKSLTSAAIGFAVSEGLLSYDDRITTFFPRHVHDNADNRIYSVTIEHLLTMTSGAFIANEVTTILQTDWLDFFLNSPLSSFPGEKFNYNSINTYVLGAILIKVCGMGLLDYLTPRLFEPLGITDIFWDKCPLGRECAGWGLYLKTEDMARFGQLLLNDGMWEGKRILPEGWVKKASSRLADNSVDIKYGDDPDVNAGYGMQFWINRDGKSFRADGMLGQYALVLPEQDAVIVTTAGDLKQLEILDLLWEKLIPELGAIPEGSTVGADSAELASLAPTLHLEKFEASRRPDIEALISGREYTFPINHWSLVAFPARYLHGFAPPGITSVRFLFGAEPEIIWCCSSVENRMPLPLNGGTSHGFVQFMGDSIPTVVSARWCTDRRNTLQVIFRAICTPHALEAFFEFSSDGMTLELDTDELPSFEESARFIVDLLGSLRIMADPFSKIAGKLADQRLKGVYDPSAVPIVT